MPQVYRIEEVAAKTGLTKRALRYYEDFGLITPSRNESGYRTYSEAEIEKLRRIVEIKDVLGVQLNELQEILELENNLTHIFGGAGADLPLLEKSLAMTAEKIRLIEEKKRNLTKVAVKYEQVFAALQQLYTALKEEGSGHEKN